MTGLLVPACLIPCSMRPNEEIQLLFNITLKIDIVFKKIYIHSGFIKETTVTSEKKTFIKWQALSPQSSCDYL